MKSNGKVAMVTGAGSGIGQRCVFALLRGGYSVVLAGRRSEALESTITEANPDPGRILTVPTDIGNPDEVANLFSQTNLFFFHLLDEV